MMFITSVALLAFILVLSVAIYNFMEGETLIADFFDEFNLSRQSTIELDQLWKANPRKSNIVISLTTTPTRIGLIEPCIKSLLRQTLAPAKIILNVPLRSKRENMDYAVPSILAKLSAIEIHRCDDWGPSTKLIPTLQRSAYDTRIVIVDDDRIYPKTLLSTLAAATEVQPESAFGLSGWLVPNDLIDRPTGLLGNIMQWPPVPIRARRQRKLSRVDVLQGQSGYMVSPRFFDLKAVSNYAGSPPAAFFVDDVWFAAHCTAKKFVCPSRRSSFQIKSRRKQRNPSGLGFVNRGPGGDERRNNSIMMKHFANAWMTGAE